MTTQTTQTTLNTDTISRTAEDVARRARVESQAGLWGDAICSAGVAALLYRRAGLESQATYWVDVARRWADQQEWDADSLVDLDDLDAAEAQARRDAVCEGDDILARAATSDDLGSHHTAACQARYAARAYREGGEMGAAWAAAWQRDRYHRRAVLRRLLGRLGVAISHGLDRLLGPVRRPY